MLFPLLLISAKVFNFRTHSLRGSRRCSFLTETFYGSIVVSLLGSHTLGSTNIVEWCLSIIPMSCVLGIFVILSSQHGRSSLHDANAEHSIFHLAARILVLLSITVVVEMAILGLSWRHPLTTLALGLCKGLACYFTIQTVSPRGSQYLVYTYSYSGMLFFLEYSYLVRNIRSPVRQQPVQSVLRPQSIFEHSRLSTCACSNYPSTSK